MTSTTPMSQTFFVGQQDSNGQDGIYVSKLDLFFAAKDSNYGVSVDIRTVDANNNPTNVVLPQSNVYMTSNVVSTSNDASVATTCVFPSPVFLKSNNYYAFTINPDASSPNYQLYVSQTGGVDLTNPTLNCRSDWGEGSLFISTNDNTSTAVQDEDIKFTLYRHLFAPLSGSVTVVNKDYEFFTCNNISGTFMHGEPVFVFANSYVLTGNVNFSNGSNILVGTNTAFLTQLTSGSIINVANTTNAQSNSSWVSFVVNSIANNTTLTLVQTPYYSSGNVAAYTSPSGIVDYFSNSTLHIKASSASNSTWQFVPNTTLIGTLTGTIATIQSIDNITLDYFNPIISRTEVTGTSLTATAQIANTTLAIQGPQNVKFNDSTYITSYQAVVGSKTNEINAGSGKSFQMTLTLNSNSPTLSPTFDTRHSSIIRYHNLINNDDTNENTMFGNSVSRYVSNPIVLADGQDAEDMSLWITGYRPSGSEIEVYARILNAYDPDNLTTKNWNKLQFVGSPRYSNPSNQLDFFDIQYKLPDVPNTTVLVGAVSTTNASSNIVGFSTLFTGNINVGDVLMINDTTNNRYFVSKANTAPGSNTTLTLTSLAPWTTTGATVQKFVNPTAVFRDPLNDKILTYFAANSTFDTYKTYAIKIVLLAQAPNIVPRVNNIRVVARSV